MTTNKVMPFWTRRSCFVTALGNFLSLFESKSEQPRKEEASAAQPQSVAAK